VPHPSLTTLILLGPLRLPSLALMGSTNKSMVETQATANSVGSNTTHHIRPPTEIMSRLGQWWWKSLCSQWREFKTLLFCMVGNLTRASDRFHLLCKKGKSVGWAFPLERNALHCYSSEHLTTRLPLLLRMRLNTEKLSEAGLLTMPTMVALCRKTRRSKLSTASTSNSSSNSRYQGWVHLQGITKRLHCN
jgi:hypothetical protein